jgi:hypothetical protein
MPLKKPGPGLWLSLALVTVLLLIPLPIDALAARWRALMYELENICHPLVFGWLAHLAFVRLRALWSRPSLLPYACVFAGAAGFGLATEVVQAVIGRDSAWVDLGNDVLGASLALLLHARAEQSARGPRSLFTVLATLAALLAVAPLAATAGAYVYRAARAPVLWQADALPYRRFSHWHDGVKYSGLVIDEPPQDWRDWQTLEVDVENLRADALDVVVGVQDRASGKGLDDRYTGRYTLPGRSRETLRIPLERIRTAPASRDMDLATIRNVIVFVPGRHRTGRPFALYAVRLAR